MCKEFYFLSGFGIGGPKRPLPGWEQFGLRTSRLNQKKMAFGTLTVFLMNFGLQTQWDYAAIEGNMEGNIKQRMPCSTFFSFGFDSIGRQHKHKGKRKRPETSNPKIKKINLRNRLASIPMHFDCFWRKNWHLQRRLANPPHACVQSQNFKSLCVDLTPQSQLVSQQKLSD